MNVISTSMNFEFVFTVFQDFAFAANKSLIVEDDTREGC